MKSLHEILKERLRGSVMAPQAEAAEVCFYAQRLLEKYLDAEMAAQARVQSVRGDVISVGVLHPAVAEAIRMHQEAILKDLQQRFGASRATSLRTKCLTSL